MLLLLMDLLHHLESIYKGEIVGDIPGIIANARWVLEDQFLFGYYQDFPLEERRAKEVELKGKPKRLSKGGRARVNPPRRRGVLPNVHGEIHVDEYISDPMQDEDGVHLDDDNEAEEEAREAREARERCFCSRWNLLPSNDSILMSPPCKKTNQAEVNQSRSLSRPTFSLFTHSQDPLAAHLHSQVDQQQVPMLQAQLQQQQSPVQTPVYKYQLPAQQQSGLQQPTYRQSVLQQPAQKLQVQKFRLQRLPAQKQRAEQLAAQQQPAHQEAPREQLHMKLRTRKHAPPGWDSW